VDDLVWRGCSTSTIVRSFAFLCFDFDNLRSLSPFFTSDAVNFVATQRLSFIHTVHLQAGRKVQFDSIVLLDQLAARLLPNRRSYQGCTDRWQSVAGSSVSFQVYSAYLDFQDQQLVRIVATATIAMKHSFHCVFWLPSNRNDNFTSTNAAAVVVTLNGPIPII
jgi:hypothetical protein